MNEETKAANGALKELRIYGKIATMRKARKGHKCHGCGEPIDPGTYYYEIVIGGGGLGSLKYPERTHITCVGKVLKGGE